VFIRDKNTRGQEISGYIDYAHRLKTEDFEVYFSGKKKFLPKPSDLRLTFFFRTKKENIVNVKCTFLRYRISTLCSVYPQMSLPECQLLLAY